MNNISKLRKTNRAVGTRKSFQVHAKSDISKINQFSFVDTSTSSYGGKIWNSLLLLIKSCKNLKTFKKSG